MMNLILFFLNFGLSIIFVSDTFDLYTELGIPLINDEVNRVFIDWFGLVTTFSNCCWFMYKHLEYRQNGH